MTIEAARRGPAPVSTNTWIDDALRTLGRRFVVALGPDALARRSRTPSAWTGASATGSARFLGNGGPSRRICAP